MRGTVAKRLRRAVYGDLSQRAYAREYEGRGLREIGLAVRALGWFKRRGKKHEHRRRFIFGSALRAVGTRRASQDAKRHYYRKRREKKIKRWPRQPRRSWLAVVRAWEERHR